MNSKSLCYKLRNIKEIQFKIKPANRKTRSGYHQANCNNRTNTEFQLHARKEIRRTQKKIEHIQQHKDIVKFFPEERFVPAKGNRQLKPDIFCINIVADSNIYIHHTDRTIQ